MENAALFFLFCYCLFVCGWGVVRVAPGLVWFVVVLDVENGIECVGGKNSKNQALNSSATSIFSNFQITPHDNADVLSNQPPLSPRLLLPPHLFSTTKNNEEGTAREFPFSFKRFNYSIVDWHTNFYSSFHHLFEMNQKMHGWGMLSWAV